MSGVHIYAEGGETVPGFGVVGGGGLVPFFPVYPGQPVLFLWGFRLGEMHILAAGKTSWTMSSTASRVTARRQGDLEWGAGAWCGIAFLETGRRCI